MFPTRLVCALLIAIGGALLLWRGAPAARRGAWIALALAALVNALTLNSQPANLLGSNLIHYHLGIKYVTPHADFYRAIQAALGRPQIGMRDLDDPARVVNAAPYEQRAYYLKLLRDAQVPFDALEPLDSLAGRARASG